LTPTALFARSFASASERVSSAGYARVAPPEDSSKGDTPHCVMVMKTGRPPAALEKAAAAPADTDTLGTVCAARIDSGSVTLPLGGEQGSSAGVMEAVASASPLPIETAASAFAPPQ
jgi:hypothetical protein